MGSETADLSVLMSDFVDELNARKSYFEHPAATAHFGTADCLKTLQTFRWQVNVRNYSQFPTPYGLKIDYDSPVDRDFYCNIWTKHADNSAGIEVARAVGLTKNDAIEGAVNNALETWDALTWQKFNATDLQSSSMSELRLRLDAFGVRKRK